MCFVDLEKVFDGVSRKVLEWAKKGIPEALVTAVMSLYKGEKTKVKVGTHLVEGFEVDIRVHQGSVLSPLLFTIVIDVVMNKIKEGVLQEILYADDIVLIAETRKNFMVEKCALESKDLNVNLVKTKVMVSKIGQTLQSHLARMTHVAFVAEDNGKCSII